MQPSIKRQAASDDEEDLESLRLAALQSLKRQVQPIMNGLPPVQIAPNLCNLKPFGGLKGLNKRSRGFHGGGRTARNGPYNNRMRNSNLISVQTIEPDQPHNSIPDINRNKKFTDQSIPKLILPQDRYCNPKANLETKGSEASSKFDRYNDSDNSDSESDSEDETTSGTESPKKLERANSLEALLQELENEIQGDLKASAEVRSKPKKVKKSRKSKPDIPENEAVLLESSDELCVSETENKSKSEVIIVKSDDAKVDVVECSKNQDVADTRNLSPKNEMHNVPVRRKSKSPIKPSILSRRPQTRSPTENCVPQNLINQPMHNLAYVNQNVPVATSVVPFQPSPYTNFSVPLGHGVSFDAPLPYSFQTAPPLGGPNDMHSPPRQMFSPNRYERPISPLTIKTDILNTISAPLSPRSAAFVLQNREIIERRKKSPRRSYSRSPSPEFLRRSLSPRYRRSNSRPSRSPSPVRQRHSPTNRRLSPRRISPGRRPSPNIRRLSPISQPTSRRSSPTSNRYRLSPPKRPSPSGRISPKRSHRSPLRNIIRNRLGGQSNQSNKPEVTVSDNERERKTRKRSRSLSLSLSPSPERFSRKNSPIRDEDRCGEVDPVLEARKRKFENGSIPTEGIIRLKPKNNSDDGSDSKDADDEKIELQADLNEELNEEEVFGGADDTYIDFNVKVDDLFSDEESDNENEGRFKSNRQQMPRDVTVMPFTQLLNGPAKTGKSETVPKRSYDRERDRRDRNRPGRGDRDKNPTRTRNTPERNRYKEDKERERPRIRQRSRSPLRTQSRDSPNNVVNKNEGKSLSTVKSNTENSKKETGTVEKRTLKNTSILKDRKRPPIVSPIENKKIEIKIRNPSKYEVESRSYDVANKDEEPVKEKKISRKVEVANDPFANELEDEDFDEPEPEIIIENEEGEDEDVINKNEDAGDLRAQLSRKRAERQNKLPKVEGVPSRLLQNALQGAVFKKSKKSKSKKKDKEAAPLDGKLPIHLRLGIPGTMDLFTDSKPHKISRKRSKNRGSFDQV